MPVFPLSQTARMRPDWWPLHASDCLVLELGESIGPAFHDAPVVYALLEGELRFREGSDECTLEAGEVAAIPAGRQFTLHAESGPAVILRMEGEPLPPFRPGPQPTDSHPPVHMTPLSPKRRGTSILFDESATFSPHLISAAQDGDLMLQINMGAVARNQVKEIRRSCDESRRAVAALIVRVDEDEDPVQFFLDRHRHELTNELKSVHVGIEADLGTDRGRLRSESFRRVWQTKLLQEGTEFILCMPWRDFSAKEQRELMEYVAHVPPAQLPLAIRFPTTNLSMEHRMVVRALLPWIRIVSARDGAGHSEFCHYFEGMAFQGWVLREI
ncbi:hypothetical protein GC173_00080 [bacterium]|nr:hypothetical protein [bacterium]